MYIKINEYINKMNIKWFHNMGHICTIYTYDLLSEKSLLQSDSYNSMIEVLLGQAGVLESG